MRVIGLTGGIGSGKSTVAGFLADLGASIVDLDKLGHDVLKLTKVRDKLVSQFGRSILGADGEIDRTRLGNIVFNNREALSHLGEITHPIIDDMVLEKLEDYRRKGSEVVVLEAAAFLESGRTAQYDELWVTTAPEETVLERIENRPGYSRETVRSRMRSQLPAEEKVRRADVVIDTDRPLDELKAKVEIEWGRLKARIESNDRRKDT